MAEVLASYSDKILKRGGTNKFNLNMEERIDELVSLFTFINDKDLYIEVYRNLLARRLLLGSSDDIESEKLMITKLKLCCGFS